MCELNSVNSTCPLKMRDNREVYHAFLWYSLTYTVTFILDIAASIYFFQLIVRANQNVHSLALLGIIKSPMRFFNTNSKGRILNRFSQDLGRADTMLPNTMYETITIFLQFFGALILAIYTNWMNVIIVIPAGAFLVYQRQYYVSSGREIKRLDSVSKSPIYNYTSETMSGRSVLKAARLQDYLTKQFMGLEDAVYFCYSFTLHVGYRTDSKSQ